MAFTLTGASGTKYTFNRYSSKKELPTTSGVYAILCAASGEEKVYYIGEAGNVHERLNSGSHEGLDCVETRCPGTISFGVHDTIGMSKDERKAIELDLIEAYDPLCNNNQ